jgi:hypothetical protein
LLIAGAVIAGLLLSRGNTLLPAPTAVPPLEFHVTPATLTAASPSRCPLTGYVAAGESPVSGYLTIGTGTTVTSVSIEVLGRRPISASEYLARAGKRPGFAGTSPSGQEVRLALSAATVAVPGLKRGGAVDLIVLPPAERSAGAIAYRWQITVGFNSTRYGPGSDSQGPFTLLAAPS